MGSEAVTPFRIEIPDRALQDVRERLLDTRWPAELMENDDWAAGVSLAFMRRLCDHWLNRYDWRVHERAMNAFDNFVTDVDDIRVHFIHERGKGPNPMPLQHQPWLALDLAWDMQKVIRPLTDPAAFGGDPADAFDVVAPSLPGFGFSSPLTDPVMSGNKVADMWPKLMARLGYERFATQGGDIGGAVVSQLGHKYPERLYGAFLALRHAGQGAVPDARRLRARGGALEAEERHAAEELDLHARGRGLWLHPAAPWSRRASPTPCTTRRWGLPPGSPRSETPGVIPRATSNPGSAWTT